MIETQKSITSYKLESGQMSQRHQVRSGFKRVYEIQKIEGASELTEKDFYWT